MNLKVPGAILSLDCAFLSPGPKIVGGGGCCNPLWRTRVIRDLVHDVLLFNRFSCPTVTRM